LASRKFRISNTIINTTILIRSHHKLSRNNLLLSGLIKLIITTQDRPLHQISFQAQDRQTVSDLITQAIKKEVTRVLK